jgi:hypothetical protein
MQRTTGRAAERQLQSVQCARCQKFIRVPDLILPDLHPIRHARRPQKQKVPEQLVIVSMRKNTPFREKLFNGLPGVQVLEHRHIYPRRES